MLVWDQIVALLEYAQTHLVMTLVAVFVGTLALSFLHATLTPPPKPAIYKCVQRRTMLRVNVVRVAQADSLDHFSASDRAQRATLVHGQPAATDPQLQSGQNNRHVETHFYQARPG